MNDVEKGFLLYRAHATLALGVLFLSFIYPKVVLFIMFPIFLYNMMFLSCPLTKIERFLHKQDITIIDPLIVAMGIPVNNTTRQDVHKFLISLFMLFLLYSSIIST